MFEVSGRTLSLIIVDIIQQFLVSDDDDWKAWDFTFSNTQGEKPQTVASLLEKVQWWFSQDKLRHACNNTGSSANALASPPHRCSPVYQF
jgi:hypothetical protein